MSRIAFRNRYCQIGLSLVLGALLLAACRKEAPLSPGAPDVLYQLPQGNHPYDQEILQFYDSYKSYILYKYDTVDYRYTFVANAASTRPSLYLQLADTNYVQAALDFLHYNWLDRYPSSFLQKTLPLRVFLSSQMDTIAYSGYPTMIDTTVCLNTSMVTGNSIVFGLANSSLPTLSAADTKTARGWLEFAFWQQANASSTVERPVGWDSLVDYRPLAIGPNISYGPMWQQKGIFPVARQSPGLVDDFLAYIFMITSTDSTTLANTWFNPQIDVNGMYQQKYKLLTSYYLNKYGIDLQAIGNLP